MRVTSEIKKTNVAHVGIVACTLCLTTITAAISTARAQEAATTLAPIVVTSTRMGTSVLDTPASVSIVDGDDMRNATLQVNLSEGLAGVPGLQIQNRQNYAQDLQISIRGFGARSTFGVRGVRLYVDGIPATMPDGQGQTSNIDIASIDRVEVLRGPFSALYGNSSGGVIQAFTEDGTSPPTISAGFAAGSYGTYRYGAKANGVANLGTSKLDYVLSGTRFTTQGYRDHSSTSKNLGNAKLGLQLDDKSKLTIIANSVDLAADDPMGLSRQQFEDDPRGVTPTALTFNTRKTVKQTQGGLIYDRQVNADNALRLMVYYGQRKTTQFQSIPVGPQLSALHAGGVIDLSRDYMGADARWTSKLSVAGRPLTLIAGLAYDELTEQRRGYQNFIGSGPAQQLGVQGALRRNETNKVHNIDPYLQASWQFAPRWTLDGGLRYSTVQFDSNDHYIVAGNPDDSGAARYRKALPVASLRYAATPNINLYTSIGRGFETPTLNEISYRPGGASGLNLALQPSVNTSVEVGAKARIAGGQLTAALFQTNTDDEIVTASNNNGRSTFQNGGRTRRNGFELGWNGEIARHWRTEFAYTWLDAKYRDDCPPSTCSNPIEAGKRIPGIAQQSIYASLGWVPPEGWRAGVEARYLSKIYVNDSNSDAAQGYFVAALNVGYVWRTGPWELSTFARVDNVFDRRYAGSVIVNDGNTRYFEPAPGRNWITGVNVAYSFR
ncbi:MAG: TonB-dependent receptor [Burkholderiaceae bacterium]